MTGVWRDDVRAWGRLTAGRHCVTSPTTAAAAMREVTAASIVPMLAHGCGRSYGDVALNPGGRLIDCTGLDRFLAFDRDSGVLTCEAGVRLADILAVICQPQEDGGGWFLPVTPGSRFVTVGGAIANDVHGKNHHLFGTFGCHLLSFDLLRQDGIVRCSPDEHTELFRATIGGIGLTGLILRASMQLRRVPGLAVEAEDIRFGTLGDFFDLAGESDASWEYTAAWIDCLAKGGALGRGIFSRARHAPGRAAAPPARSPRLRLPMAPPLSLANRLTVRAFNALYWRKLGPGRSRSRRISGYEPVLYPLDALGGWNRLYGPHGFYQLQCVVPSANAHPAVAEMLAVIAASGQGSMLSVLKLFGDHPSPGLMSFPMPGATLALDFPNQGTVTHRLLARLERIAVAAGGRIYPAKDAVMAAGTFRDGYPQLDRFLRQVAPGFSSGFARRVASCPHSAIEAAAMPDQAACPAIAIFGATSGIAIAVARQYAQSGCRLVLVGRNRAELAAAAPDLTTRGANQVAVQYADFANTGELPAVAEAAWAQFRGLDIALIAYGTLPDQAAAERSSLAAEADLVANFTSPVMLITELARRFQAQATGGRRGTIAAISSVAGDRGRKSNYVYGAAKGGLQRYLEGLRHRLHAAGVNVLDIRPGFVSTNMTAHLDRRGPLWATPDRVATDIVRAVAARRAVVYTPWFWRGVMVVIRNVPRAVFHRTSL